MANESSIYDEAIEFELEDEDSDNLLHLCNSRVFTVNMILKLQNFIPFLKSGGPSKGPRKFMGAVGPSTELPLDM